MHKAIRFFPGILLLFHLIGVGLFIHFASAPEGSFINIFLSALLVLISEQHLKRALIPFAIIFIGGFVIELIGVQTGLLFGQYIYEPSMGPMLFGTPLIIGSTWYAVVVGASTISRYVKGSVLARSLLAGILAVLMDLLIEQVAISYGLWSWESGSIPFYNYVCWFIFGTLFSYIYFSFTTDTNKTAFYLYWIWLGFFSILTIF